MRKFIQQGVDIYRVSGGESGAG